MKKKGNYRTMKRQTKKKNTITSLFNEKAACLPKNQNFNAYKVQQIEELKEIFKMYDRDNTGEITDRTLKFLLRGLGDHVNEEEAEEIKKKMDEDGNGTIDFREFMLYMLEKINNQSLCDDITQVFKVLDREGSGFMTPIDLKIYTAGLLQEKQVNDFFMKADINNEGQIDYKRYLERLLK